MKVTSKTLAVVLAVSSMIAAAGMLRGASGQSSALGEDQARREIDAVYKGDYRRAFQERKPELVLEAHPGGLQVGHR